MRGLLSFFLVVVAATPARAEVPTSFVRVQGTQFTVDGHAFSFLGANASLIHGPRERRTAELALDAMAADGVKVVRVFAFGEAPQNAEDWVSDFVFRRGQQGWIESSFVTLDRLISGAKQRNMRVILVLANRWADFGGAPEYLRWSGTQPADRNLSELELENFFRCDSCKMEYLNHVTRLINRRNTVDNIRYEDDPGIFSWELMNEASATTPRAAADLAAWVSDVSKLIHKFDAHHLVGAGIGGYRTRLERHIWQSIQALPTIDYCDAHVYPKEDARIRDESTLTAWIDDAVQLAHHVIKKPIIWGEFGIPLEASPTADQDRAAWFQRFLSASERDAVNGAIVWSYQCNDSTADGHGIYFEGDTRARSERTRAVLRMFATHFGLPHAESNPALNDARGDTPLFTARQTITGPRHAAATWTRGDHRATATFEALEFERAEFEAVGTHEEGLTAHFWGAGDGAVEYAFPTTGRLREPDRVTLRARISSELVGTGPSADVEDISEIHVFLGAIEIGTVVAPPDDGLGRVIELAVTDAGVLHRVFEATKRGHPMLRFVASGERGVGGICIYGRAAVAHSRAAAPTPSVDDVPGRIVIEWNEKH